MDFTREQFAYMEAFAERVAEAAVAKMRKRKKASAGPVLLSTAAAAEARIATQKPHLARPTWTYQGQQVTCVWPLH